MFSSHLFFYFVLFSLFFLSLSLRTTPTTTNFTILMFSTIPRTNFTLLISSNVFYHTNNKFSLFFLSLSLRTTTNRSISQIFTIFTTLLISFRSTKLKNRSIIFHLEKIDLFLFRSLSIWKLLEELLEQI
ncbi:unnamed protein product [Trifolium pratense]|uniref:Uncharacterized protein n=1 Tax=Trifolium pratense TaxID=57577 RepID=A0ACB0K5B4_TRIPR|nr:unnamed protein product [Trifolium pratense]